MGGKEGGREERRTEGGMDDTKKLVNKGKKRPKTYFR